MTNKKLLIIKLTSGEELLGNVFWESQLGINKLLFKMKPQPGQPLSEEIPIIDDHVYIHVPVQILYAPGQGFVMAPYAPYTIENTLCINQNNIQWIGIPDERVVHSYNEKFGNGIVLPKKELIV